MLKKLTLALIASAFLAPLAQAQILLPQDRGYLGLLLGHTTTTDIDGRFGFGAEGGLAFTNGFTGSIYFMSSTGETSGVDMQVLHYGVGLDYSLSRFLNGLFVGARLGMSTAEALNVQAADKESAFAGGLALGYDHMINESFSLGAQVQAFSNSWTPSTTSTYFLVSGKFWL